MDDEWEEEEQLVVVELSGIMNNDFLSKNRGTCKILDIDSDMPMMQVGPYTFAGEYEDALGTCVLFEEQVPKGKKATGPELKYKCHTVKRLMMQRIFLTEKKESEDGPGGSCDQDKNKDTVCQPSQGDAASEQRNKDAEEDKNHLDDMTAG